MKKNLYILNALTNETPEDGNTIQVSDKEPFPLPFDHSMDYTFDLKSENADSRISNSLESLNNLVILNATDQRELNEKTTKHMILKCFSIIKRIIPLVMMNRGCRIWLVHFKHNEKKFRRNDSVMQQVLKEGLFSLSRAFAMEMAKRRININFVEINSEKSWNNFIQLIENLRPCIPFNLTAQEIKIEE